MDPLVPALVLALMLMFGDRSSMLTAVLADRFGAPGQIAIAATLAHLAGNAIAAGGAMLIAPRLAPDARTLMVALALIFAGIGAIAPVRAPDPLAGWRIGATGTALAGVFILAFGDSLQFATAALVVRSESPILAVLGATAGALAVNLAAAYRGVAGWRALPHRLTRIGIGAILLICGIVIGLGALKLI